MALDTVYVWLIRTELPDPAVATLAKLLDGEEMQRAGAMPPDRRRRFVSAHGAARLITGQHLGAPPEQLRWRRGPHGKPELAGEWQGVRVNLSHSGELALLAVTANRAVGVDVQELRRLDACRLAARFFPAAEARFVAAAPGPAGQVARFTRLWTRKEACVKAAGGRLLAGMALPVHAGEVVLPGPYRVRDVPVPHGFRAALALAGGQPYRVLRRWWRPPT